MTTTLQAWQLPISTGTRTDEGLVETIWRVDTVDGELDMIRRTMNGTFYNWKFQLLEWVDDEDGDGEWIGVDVDDFEFVCRVMDGKKLFMPDTGEFMGFKKPFPPEHWHRQGCRLNDTLTGAGHVCNGSSTGVDGHQVMGS